ncbi:MAG: fasciclin domain-containing protein [Bacteroidota bacterium]
MKKIQNIGKWLLLLALVSFVFACSSDDDNGSSPDTDQQQNPDDDSSGADDNTDNTETTLNIVELATSLDDLSSLVAALQAADAGLVEALSAEGAMTVFAPTNDAFADLLGALDGFDTLADFDTDAEKTLLADILKYHVVATGALLSAALSDGDELTTLQTEVVEIVIDGNVAVKDKTAELATVTAANNQASNGVVHLINKVLLPQSVLDQLAGDTNDDDDSPEGTVVDIVVNTEDLSLLEQAVVTAGLVDALNGDGPFTIFAPSNDAIAALFDLLGDNYNSFSDFNNPIELLLLQQILRYHVVPQQLTSSDLSVGSLPTLQEGQTIAIKADGGTFTIGDASATDANLLEVDKLATNGVVHIIDKILISQEVADLLGDLGIDIDDPIADGLPTIKELVQNSEELNFLEEALRLTGLLDTLGEDGPFTVLAPANGTLTFLFGLLGNSVNSLDDFDLEFEIAILRDVLKYHVIPGRITSNDLAVGRVETLLGDTIEILQGPDGFLLKDATDLIVNITVTDIPASNGVIHVVDRVLIPNTVIATIVEETTGNFERLIALLEGNEALIAALLMAGDDIQEALDNSAPFTFFLPTNQAFLNVFDALDGIDSLLDFDTVAELELLATILSYHLVPDIRARSGDLSDGQIVETFQGETLAISLTNGVAVVDATGIPAQVTAADQGLLNGVVHFIDKVLLPQEVLDQL